MKSYYNHTDFPKAGRVWLAGTGGLTRRLRGGQYFKSLIREIKEKRREVLGTNRELGRRKAGGTLGPLSLANYLSSSRHFSKHKLWNTWLVILEFVTKPKTNASNLFLVLCGSWVAMKITPNTEEGLWTFFLSLDNNSKPRTKNHFVFFKSF